MPRDLKVVVLDKNKEIRYKELEMNKEYYSIKFIFNKSEKIFKPENPPCKLLKEQMGYIKIFKDYEYSYFLSS